MAISQSIQTALSIADVTTRDVTRDVATRDSGGVDSHGPAITATTIKTITKTIP